MKRTLASQSSPIYILWKSFYPGNKRNNAQRGCFSNSNSSVLRNVPPRGNGGEEHRLLARFKTLPKRVNNRCSFQPKIAVTHYSDNAAHLSRCILREVHFDAWLKPTLYSGIWRRKKQAKTSSQWKVPLCVPIFFKVMFSVQGFFGLLDMYLICSTRRGWIEMPNCWLSRVDIRTNLIVLIRGLVRIKLLVRVSIRTTSMRPFYRFIHIS